MYVVFRLRRYKFWLSRAPGYLGTRDEKSGLGGHLIPSVDDFRQNPCYTTEAFRLRSDAVLGASALFVWLAQVRLLRFGPQFAIRD